MDMPAAACFVGIAHRGLACFAEVRIPTPGAGWPPGTFPETSPRPRAADPKRMTPTKAGATPAGESPVTPTDSGHPAAKPLSNSADILADAVRSLTGATKPDATPEPTDPGNEPSTGQAGEGAATDHSQTEDRTRAADDPATDPETGADDGDAAEDDRDKLPKWAVNRLSRVKDQRNKARAEADELRGRIAEMERQLQEVRKQPEQPEAKPAAAESDNPLSSLSDPAEIESERKRAIEVVDQADDALVTLHDDPDQVEQLLRKAGIQLEDYTPAAMRQVLKDIRRRAAETARRAPDRIRELEVQRTAEAEARKIFPDLADPKSETSVKLEQVARALPGFMRRPDWKFQAAVWAVGWQELQKRQQATGKPETKAPAATVKAAAKVPGVSKHQPSAPAPGKTQQPAFGPQTTLNEAAAALAAELRQ